MIKKIFWFLIFVFVLYILAIFSLPTLADRIWEALKIEKFNEQVRWFKKKLDEVYTNLPSKEEWKDTWNKVLSGAIDLKNKVLSWAESIKWVIDDTRETVNDYANTLTGAIQDVKKVKEQADWIIKDIENISNSVSWTGS
jgi:hypothetical protein